MTTPESQSADEEFEKQLSSSLQRVTDFLKYAEAKNGVLLTFCSAWIFAMVNIAVKDIPFPGFAWYKYTALPCFIVAASLALASFFPRISFVKFLGRRVTDPQSRNLLFFGDIASLSISEFRTAIRAKYITTDVQGKNAYLDDLITQISINSRITKGKLRLFQAGLWFVALAAIAGICGTLPFLIIQIRSTT